MTTKDKIGLLLLCLGAVGFCGCVFYLGYTKIAHDLKFSEEISLAFKLSPLGIPSMISIGIGLYLIETK
ncbi:MAG: hypothetical protein ISR98_01985 [Parcubacteria group bacterium]|nr:hypothetical protein [Parcubacteria group bacterium]